MEVRKECLWKVPVFCMAAGFLLSNAVYFLLYDIAGKLVLISTDWYEVNLLDVPVFALSLVLGTMYFRGMSRREIFCSATIMVLFQAAIMLLWCFTGWADTNWRTFYYLIFAELSSWCSFPAKLMGGITGMLAEVLMPYIFVVLAGDHGDRVE